MRTSKPTPRGANLDMSERVASKEEARTWPCGLMGVKSWLKPPGLTDAAKEEGAEGERCVPGTEGSKLLGLEPLGVPIEWRF